MIQGLPEFNARMLNLIRALPDEIEKALEDESNIILNTAKRRCPVDTGDLQDSGMLQKPEKEGHMMVQPITFGDPDPYYAIFVHEDLDAKHPNGGEAKFLEKSVLEAAPGLSKRLSMRIQIERLVR